MQRVVVVIEGATVEQVREVAVREGWQMPLAPFIADRRDQVIVGALSRVS